VSSPEDGDAGPVIRARVVGLGGRLAGDDAVGLAVIEQLAHDGELEGVELVGGGDPSALLEAARGCRLLVVVDAALTEGPPGTVLVLRPAELAKQTRSPSSHGIGLDFALQLVATLWRDVRPEIVVVAISIGEARRGSPVMSPQVAGAVPAAAGQVRRLLAAHSP
jgi:hydrogenase maturation protease